MGRKQEHNLPPPPPPHAAGAGWRARGGRGGAAGAGAAVGGAVVLARPWGGVVHGGGSCTTAARPPRPSCTTVSRLLFVRLRSSCLVLRHPPLLPGAPPAGLAARCTSWLAAARRARRCWWAVRGRVLLFLLTRSASSLVLGWRLEAA